MRSIADPLIKDLINRFSLCVDIQSDVIVIDRNCGYENSEGHLQVLTPNVIDRGSINKVFDRSLKPLCRCVVQ
jgi:hypothetical protein